MMECKRIRIVEIYLDDEQAKDQVLDIRDSLEVTNTLPTRFTSARRYHYFDQQRHLVLILLNKYVVLRRS